MPFHPDLSVEPAPPTGLEVWDPFGEVRIVQLPSSEKAPSLSAATTSTRRAAEVQNPPPEREVVNPESPANTDKQTEDELGSTRAKRKKKPRKKPDLGAKAPQVQLQFSGKDD